MMKKIFTLLFFTFCFCFAINFNEQINDEAQIFSKNEKAELLSLVQNYEQNSTTQIAIVTLKSLENKSIEEVSLEVARGYKLGQKQSSNGALLIIAPNERKVRIEVGYGLEGVLTDAISSQIINDVVVPKFKQGDMGGGVVDGIRAIIKVASGEEFESVSEDEEIPFGIVAFFVGMISCFVSGFLGKFFMRIGFSACFAGLISTVFEQFFGVQNYFIVFAIVFVIFFIILKNAFKKNTQSKNTYSGFRRDKSDSNSSGSGHSSSSRGGGFSGGGGGFGGGGASGSW